MRCCTWKKEGIDYMSPIKTIVTATVVGCLAFASETACTGESKGEPSSKSLSERISSEGARQVLSKLMASETQWKGLRIEIANGKQDSLVAGMTLYLSADAGAKEMLGHSFGEALKPAASKVLELAKRNNLPMSELCQSPDVDDDRFNSYDRSVQEIAKRKQAVEAISQSSLSGERSACLAALESAAGSLARFFGVEAGK